MLTNAPIETSAPRLAEAATSARRWMPLACDGRGENSSTARAKAKYGFAARSIAHGAASARSPRITADARVWRSCAAYFGLTKKVSSPGRASSMPATPWMSTSPSPSSRHSRRSAMSVSLNVRSIPAASRRGRALEEAGEVLEAQRVGDGADPLLARVRRIVDQRSQRGERGARLHRPVHGDQPAPRAAQREGVAAGPHQEVVADDVGAGEDDQQRRSNQAETVDDHPEAMALPVALQRAPQQLTRVRFADVVGIDQARRDFLAKLPEQALLRDPLGDPPHQPRLDAAEERARRLVGRRPVPALPFGLVELLADPMRDAAEEAARRRRVGSGRRLVVLFAIQLVPIGRDRYEKHVHRVKCTRWTGSHPASGKQPEHDHDQRHDQQDVNQPAGDVHRETKEPQNQQKNDNGPEHPTSCAVQSKPGAINGGSDAADE